MGLQNRDPILVFCWCVLTTNGGIITKKIWIFFRSLNIPAGRQLVLSSTLVLKVGMQFFHAAVCWRDSRANLATTPPINSTGHAAATHSDSNAQLSRRPDRILSRQRNNWAFWVIRRRLPQSWAAAVWEHLAKKKKKKRSSLSYVQSIRDFGVKSFNTYYLGLNEEWHACIGRRVIGHSAALFLRHEAGLFKVVIMTTHTGNLVWEHR